MYACPYCERPYHDDGANCTSIACCHEVGHVQPVKSWTEQQRDKVRAVALANATKQADLYRASLPSPEFLKLGFYAVYGVRL